ncbi:hypothetical protein KRX54_02500 [Actinomycetaceae bacterium TAE3-ERU4]|nr:hypothetical protein [Actinomycetaceae bacterium TAE3-ERU4]
MKRSPLAALMVAVIACSGLAGCGSSNAGSKTTCGDFVKMSAKEQKEVMRSYLEEKGESNPSNGKVALVRLSAKAFCATAGSDSSTIGEIDGNK